MSTSTALLQRMTSARTLACCGLDPDYRRLPAAIKGSNAERSYEFLREVVAIAAPHVCAFKVQKAFFDALPGGHEILAQLVRFIHNNHPGIPVFVDCKIGDIDNTMAAYVDYLLGDVNADGVLVNPYMGDEVLAAFDDHPHKAVIVLARTSNSGASIVQDALMADGRPLWEYILDLVVTRWNRHGNLIPVISSTAGLDLRRVRSMIPDEMPILLAGVGAQGGDYSELRKLRNSDGTGVFVNSSRGLLYPSNPSGHPWREVVAHAVMTFRRELAKAQEG